MGYEDIARYMGVGLIAWLSALAVLIGYKLLSGAMLARGILRSTDADGSRVIDMERLQLLIIFLISAAFYVKTGIAALDQPQAVTIMPEPPRLLIDLLIASNAIYLAGKFGRNLQKGDAP